MPTQLGKEIGRRINADQTVISFLASGDCKVDQQRIADIVDQTMQEMYGIPNAPKPLVTGDPDVFHIPSNSLRGMINFLRNKTADIIGLPAERDAAMQAALKTLEDFSLLLDQFAAKEKPPKH